MVVVATVMIIGTTTIVFVVGTIAAIIIVGFRAGVRMARIRGAIVVVATVVGIMIDGLVFFNNSNASSTVVG